MLNSGLNELCIANKDWKTIFKKEDVNIAPNILVDTFIYYFSIIIEEIKGENKLMSNI